MTRRDALLRLTTLVGGTIFGASHFLSGRVLADQLPVWTPLATEDLALLNEVGETILPTTVDSAGAKAADVAAFMQEIARDFYDESERKQFRGAAAWMNDRSAAKYGGRGFLALEPDERFALLLELERAAPPHPTYQMLKQLTVWGYWSSEVGATQALQHLPVPGKFAGCISVGPETKAWSN